MKQGTIARTVINFSSWVCILEDGTEVEVTSQYETRVPLPGNRLTVRDPIYPRNLPEITVQFHDGFTVNYRQSITNCDIGTILMLCTEGGAQRVRFELDQLNEYGSVEGMPRNFNSEYPWYIDYLELVEASPDDEFVVGVLLGLYIQKCVTREQLVIGRVKVGLVSPSRNNLSLLLRSKKPLSAPVTVLMHWKLFRNSLEELGPDAKIFTGEKNEEISEFWKGYAIT